MLKKKSILVFGKAQVSAFVGGLFDYSVMVFCTEVFKIHYTNSIVIGGLLGALVNFSINKYWTYQAKELSLASQLIKFYLVVAGSIFLKSSGTFLLTENLHIDYKITRLIVDLFVSIGFNFMLQKYWVFRTSSISNSINKISDTSEKKTISIENREYQEA